MIRKSSSVLDEVRAAAQADAEEEAARLAGLKAAKALEEAQRLAEAQARIEAETRLRIEAEARRRALVEAQRHVVSTPMPRQEDPDPIELSSEEPVPVRLAAPRSTGFWLAVVSLPAVCATAVALAWILGSNPEPQLQAPPPTPMPEVAAAPERPLALEVMPVAHAFEPAPVVAVVSEAPRPAVKRPRPVRPVAPATEKPLSLDNLLETDDTRPRR